MKKIYFYFFIFQKIRAKPLRMFLVVASELISKFSLYFIHN